MAGHERNLPLLTVEQVDVRFGKFQALAGVSLDVAQVNVSRVDGPQWLRQEHTDEMYRWRDLAVIWERSN